MNYLKKKRLSLMKNKQFCGYMKTVSGYPLTLSNCMENGLINISVAGEAGIYDGEYYNININISGINLFDIHRLKKGNGGGYVEGESVYVTGYPYQPGLYPADFLDMTRLHANDTFTCVSDYEQIAAGLYTKYVAFNGRNSNPKLYIINISNAPAGQITANITHGIIPANFSTENYLDLYLYGGNATPTDGNVRAIYHNIMLCKGEYTVDTIPEYEAYHDLKTFNIRDVSALGANDKITIDFKRKKAIRINNAYSDFPDEIDITEFQDWSTLPHAWHGTVVIDSEAPMMEASYYSDIQEV